MDSDKKNTNSLLRRVFGMLRTAPNVTPQQAKERLATPPRTSEYEPQARDQFWTRIRDLPPFNFLYVRQMWLDSTIRLGVAMRAAPLFAAEFAYKEGEKWTPGIRACREDVAAFVLRTLEKLWRNDLHSLVESQIWGWAGGEVMLKLSRARVLEYECLLPRRAEDMRVMVRDGEACGVQVKHVPGQGDVDLEFPRCLLTHYKPAAADWYGRSALEGAFSPWVDKWHNGGALDVRRLFMVKDAYRGAKMRYPNQTYDIPGYAQPVPAQNIARELVEQIRSGGVVTLMSDKDDAGNYLWDFEESHVSANPQHILQYPKDLDVEILRGLEIPDDVLTAEATGSWAGKTVPMQAFYNGLEIWLQGMLRDIKRQLLEPLVHLNFGPGMWFEVETKPLAQQAMEQQGEKSQGNSVGPSMFQPGIPMQAQQSPPHRVAMSLNPVEAVGEGVLSAGELVKAAREALNARPPQ